MFIDVALRDVYSEWNPLLKKEGEKVCGREKKYEEMTVLKTFFPLLWGKNNKKHVGGGKMNKIRNAENIFPFFPLLGGKIRGRGNEIFCSRVKKINLVQNKHP